MFHQREFSTGPAEEIRPSFWRFAAWPLRVLAARQALTQLATMDDRELADIGLHRQDLRDATALGLGDDPTELFAKRAGERRCARWRAAGRYGSSRN
jgi:uncharacterized protein YjiS (DUF1127 family)